jgi:hypothetical protein
VRYLQLIDSSGNLQLVDIDTEVRMAIGEPLDPEGDANVIAGTWSFEGQWTAWSIDSPDMDGARQIRLHDEHTDSAAVLAEAVTAFYMCPSPDGRFLSHLSPGPLGLELAVTEIVSGDTRIIERGQPMFWSWSPDATQLAVHVGSRVLIAGIDGSQPHPLSLDADPFITPCWLPGGSVAYAAAGGIVSSGLDTSVTTLIERTSGRFSIDPDGRRLAHLTVVDNRAALVVHDLLTGETSEITSEPVGAFFWSTQGQLAALVAAAADHVRWLVADGAEVVALPPFRPGAMWSQTVLSFFEQYAQSHACWSPDGKHLVAPAVDEQGHAGAWVHEVARPHQAQWVPDGVMVWWA